MMKVLITGGTGMVGRNLIETAPDDVELLCPIRTELDLLSYDSTTTYIRKEKPDFIIHCAGIVGGIQANIAEPTEFLVSNTDMGRNLLLAAKENGVQKLLNLGSSCMYPKDSNDLLKEDQILTGILEPTNEGYAIAKIFTQRLASYISREFDLNYKTIIPCNLYGRFDKFDPQHSHMIPAVIHKIHEAKVNNEKMVEIWGDGTARREFMFAGDLALMIWQIVAKFDETPEVMNVGLGEDISINDYYHSIAQVIGYKGEFYHNLDRPVGMKRKVVNIEKQLELGLKAQYSLEAGIKETYNYYLNHIIKS